MSVYAKGNTVADWQQLPVELTSTELRVGGKQVMQSWERPIMEAMVRAIRFELLKKQDAHTLEVGFGMGLASMFMRRCGASRRVIIEAHPTITENARRFWEWHIGEGLANVVEGFWQNVVPTLADASFDAILFDTFPLRSDKADANPCDMIPHMARLLKPGGVLTWYSGAKRRFPHDQLGLAFEHFAEVRLIKVGGLEPFDHCDYWSGDEMIVPVAIKGGGE